ncbi:hypothetical protein [Gloeobacter morelensis]|uniref:Lipoprotein n=1 Tax=Gloeobacter morelensis MG652769 TaxID=2781736 RepID=A0ABY3PJQ1_9CYAN|nr:hypothetical protein [Gloeobacter morelensis]UFP93792.1 hypothetical protein ISF26_18740 [Gloeobacter morelensis MG652769]
MGRISFSLAGWTAVAAVVGAQLAACAQTPTPGEAGSVAPAGTVDVQQLPPPPKPDGVKVIHRPLPQPGTPSQPQTPPPGSEDKAAAPEQPPRP